MLVRLKVFQKRRIGDTRSAVFCRSDDTFVDQMDQFIRGTQSVDNTPVDLKSEYSVKRCVFASAVEAPIRGDATRKLQCG